MAPPAETTPPATPQSLVEVVTTTIWTTDPTPFYVPPTASSNRLPLGAIIGGLVTGFFTACVVVIGWVWWGKCIKRKQAKQRKKALDELTLKENTRKNAMMTTTRKRGHSLRQSLGLGPSTRTIKFANSDPKFDAMPDSSSSNTLDSSSSIDLSREKAGPPAFHLPFRPSPLRQTTADSISSPESSLIAYDGGDATAGFSQQLQETKPLPECPQPSPQFLVPEPMPEIGPSWTISPPTPTPPQPALLELQRPDDPETLRLSHKTSVNTVSSMGSVYSAQSGEGRRRSVGGWGVVARLSGWTRSNGSAYSALEEKQEEEAAEMAPGGYDISEKQGHSQV